jgi:adenylylsulfate kinase-like enzyme
VVLLPDHRGAPQAHPHKRGFTVFTGLSGSGVDDANALLVKLLEIGSRRVTLLDGDMVRKHFPAARLLARDTRHQYSPGSATSPPRSPIRRRGDLRADRTRRDPPPVARMVEKSGGFVEIRRHPAQESAETRDRKGLYAKARAGTLEFTGISDRTSRRAEMRIDAEPVAGPGAPVLVKLETWAHPLTRPARVRAGAMTDCLVQNDAVVVNARRDARRDFLDDGIATSFWRLLPRHYRRCSSAAMPALYNIGLIDGSTCRSTIRVALLLPATLVLLTLAIRREGHRLGPSSSRYSGGYCWRDHRWRWRSRLASAYARGSMAMYGVGSPGLPGAGSAAARPRLP